MANIQSAKKRARQNTKRRLHNASIRSAMRTSIKKVLAAVEAGNKDEAATAFKAAAKYLDQVAGKGIIHRNKAARHKSRLNAKVKALSA